MEASKHIRPPGFKRNTAGIWGKQPQIPGMPTDHWEGLKDAKRAVFRVNRIEDQIASSILNCLENEDRF